MNEYYCLYFDENFEIKLQYKCKCKMLLKKKNNSDSDCHLMIFSVEIYR